jgi:hypothetical protein
MTRDEIDDLMRRVGEAHSPPTWEEAERENRHAIYLLEALTGGIFIAIIGLGIYTHI